MALPARNATNGPNRSATAPQIEEGDRGRDRGEDADDTDVGQAQVEPVDVDDGEQRRRRDQAAAVEPLRQGDPPEQRPLTQGADRVSSGEGGRSFHGCRAKPGVPDGAHEPDDARQRDGRWSTDTVRDDPTGKGGDGTGRGSAHAEEPDDTAAQPGRVDGSPQAQVEWPAERDAQPERDRDGDHHGRCRPEEDRDQGGRADAAQDRELAWRACPEPTGEDAKEVGDERSRRERGEAQRFEAAASRDRRQQRRDERHRDADARRPRPGRGRGCARARARWGMA